MSSSRRSPVLLHTAFYQFTPLPQPEEVAARLRELVSQHVDGLTGSILVATEGINGMLAGTMEAVDRIETALLQDAAFAGAFNGMAFKRSTLNRLQGALGTLASP